MKLIANNYEPKEIFKILREWTGLTQTELAKELGYKTYHSIKQIERGVNTINFNKVIQMIKKYNILVTFEKK